MNIDKRDFVLSNVIGHNGNLKHRCLSNGWFAKKKKEEVFMCLYELTNFLDKFNPSLRERIFYVQNNFDDFVICKFCNLNKVGFKGHLLCSTCGSKECNFRLKSKTMKLIHKNLSVEEKEERHKNFGKRNIGSLEKRFGLEKATKIKKAMSFAKSGKVSNR